LQDIIEARQKLFRETNTNPAGEQEPACTMLAYEQIAEILGQRSVAIKFQPVDPVTDR
jgi:hypothetical protein